MAGTYYPTKDAEFSIWLGNFISVASGNLTALGLVAADIDPVKSIQPTYAANLSDVENKKTDLASSVETKDATKAFIIQNTRIIVNKIQANPAVTPPMKSAIRKMKPVTALQQKNTWPTPRRITRRGRGRALSIFNDQSMIDSNFFL